MKSWAVLSRLGAAVLFSSTLMAQQPVDRAHAEALARRATERVQALQREADALAAQERTLLGELRRLEVERQLKVQELVKISAELTNTTGELTATVERFDRLEREAKTERPDIEARLVELYKLGRPGYLRLLLSVSDLRKVGRAYRFVSALAKLDRDRASRHERTLTELRRTRTGLELRLKEVVALEEGARRASEAVDRAVATRSQLIAAIDTRRDLNAELMGELQHAQVRLQGALAAMAGGRAPADPVALPLGPFRGDLEWPVAGPVSTRFGRQRRSRFGTAIVRNGIEISAAEGTPVRAVHDGRVAFADQFAGFGNLVIVEHGDESYSLYGYLSTLNVQPGAALERREVVGEVGQAPTGAPALYFELRVDGKPVDPVQWLKVMRVSSR